MNLPMTSQPPHPNFLRSSPLPQGKAFDIENQDPGVIMQDRTSPSVVWKDFEDCLKRDDSGEFEKRIKGKDPTLVWRPSGVPAKATLLHKVAEYGSIKCMKLLIKVASEHSEKDFSFDSPDNNGDTPLFVAVKATQKQAIIALLEANVHVNARDECGCSVLHTIIHALSRTSTGDDSKQRLFMECLDILLNVNDIDVETKNNVRNTPLVDAAERYARKENNSLVLVCKKLVRRGASLEARNCENKSLKEILAGKPFLDELTREPKPSIARPFRSQLIESLLLGENLDQVMGCLRRQDPELAVKLSNSYLGRKSLLFFAAKDGDLASVQALLEMGADSWKKDLSGDLCLHTALSRGNPEILECIIQKMKEQKNLGRREKFDMTSESFALLQTILENYRKDLVPKVDVDHIKCLRIFLKNVKVDVNAHETGHITQSILHLTASYNNQEAAKLLLEGGAFLGSRKTVGDEDRGTVLKALRPETLTYAMDGCIVPHQPPNQQNEPCITEDTTSPDYTLNLKYQFLIPPNSDKPDAHKINEVKTLMEVSENKINRKVVKHPLIQTFLYAKWRKVLPFYLLNLFFYFIFVVLLTLFMYSVKNLKIKEEREAILEEASNSTMEENTEKSRNTVYILKAFLLLFTLYILVREIFQIVYTFRRYWTNFENYLEWPLLIIVAIFCLAHSSISVNLTRHLAAWAMIIAWYKFVLLLGRAPPLAIYVTMLRHVSWNFLKLIFLYGALILAFTVSFNIILQPTSGSEETGMDFNNFWSTFPKSIVMATGEFEYSNLRDTFFSSNAFFATSSILVFLVFIFLIFLVLMNVMSGLAVTDAQEVVEEATLYSLQSRLELIYLIEEMLLVMRSTKLLSMIHLISTPNLPQLTVKVNNPKDNERITFGDSKQKHFCKLNDETADSLRSHRIEELSKKAEKMKLDPSNQCLQLLKMLNDKVETNSQVLKSLTTPKSLQT